VEWGFDQGKKCFHAGAVYMRGALIIRLSARGERLGGA
jgi:hypothetical protein